MKPIAFTTVPRSFKIQGEQGGYVMALTPWLAMKHACTVAFLAVHAALGFGGGNVGGLGMGIVVWPGSRLRRMVNNVPQLKHVKGGWYRPDVEIAYPDAPEQP